MQPVRREYSRRSRPDDHHAPGPDVLRIELLPLSGDLCFDLLSLVANIGGNRVLHFDAAVLPRIDTLLQDAVLPVFADEPRNSGIECAIGMTEREYYCMGLAFQ